MNLAHGGRADFRGEPRATYSLVSSPGLAVNIGIDAAAFKLQEVIVEGTFITSVHVVSRTILDREFRLSFNSHNLGEKGWSFDMINASCGTEQYLMFPHKTRDCDEINVAVEFSSFVLTTASWRFKIAAMPIYDRISGSPYRLDVGVEVLVDEEDLNAHGLIGQTFDGSGIARFGRQDSYPPLEIPAVFTTRAQAEGAIEGVAADYKLASSYATAFKFSRFDEVPKQATRQLSEFRNLVSRKLETAGVAGGGTCTGTFAAKSGQVTVTPTSAKMDIGCADITTAWTTGSCCTAPSYTCGSFGSLTITQSSHDATYSGSVVQQIKSLLTTKGYMS